MKSNALMKFFLKFLLPVLIFVILFFFNSYAALAFAVLYIAYSLYDGRSAIFAIMGNVSYGKGDVQKSMEWFRKAYATGKAQPKTIISYAYLLLKYGKVNESEAILDKFLSKSPAFDDEMLAKSNLALVLWKKGNLDGAVDLLEEVFSKYKTTTIYGSLGYLLILKGDLEKALAFNLEAYDYNNSNSVIVDNLAQNYYLLGELDKSEEIYEKLMSQNPTYPEAYYNYGLTLEAKGKIDKALEIMEKALNFQFTFLSTVSREDVENKLKELKSKKKNSGEQ